MNTHVCMQAVIGPAGSDLACSLKKLEGHKKNRRKHNRARFFQPCDTDPEAPSCLRVDERPYLEDVFQKNPQVVKVIENTKTKLRWHQVLLAKMLDIVACVYRTTPCFIDNTNDYELHDTTLADGANLYQLDSIQRCLSETEFANLIHEFGVASANVLNPTHITGCGDNGAAIDRAFDSKAWDVFARQKIEITIAGQLYTIIKTGISGDLKFLWMIMGCLQNYDLRCLGSGPFAVSTCHQVSSNGMMKFWIPIVFTTLFRQSLVNKAQLLRSTIADTTKSRAIIESASAALGKISHFVHTELKLDLSALSRVKFGWDQVDYGQLHEAGTSGMRYLDGIVRLWSAMGLLNWIMTLIHNCVIGRVEVRLKTHRVKTPIVGVSATQGEVIKLCKISLETLSGFKHPKWMIACERAEALEEANQVFTCLFCIALSLLLEFQLS